MWYFRSPQVVFGEDSLSFLSQIDIKRAVIVTDKNLEKTSLPKKVSESLPDGAESIILGDIGEEPSLSEMSGHMSDIEKFSPDWFIAVGGGSSIDTAKILFFLYERPDLSVYDATPLVPLGLRKKSRLIAVPTTSGTGSECSWAAVLSEEAENRKNELASPEILPDYAILDPELVASLPPEQTKNTAIDAVTHAIEAYVSAWNNPYSDALAEKSLELISENLENVLENPGNLNYRNNVHIGASMAGLSFSNSQIGLAHALGHSLGAHFRIPHGKSVGIFLPIVVKFNYESVTERYNRLNRIIPDRYREQSLHESILKVLDAVEQDTTIKGVGIGETEFNKNLESLVSIASESTGMVTNPRDANSEDLRNLFIEAYGGV